MNKIRLNQWASVIFAACMLMLLTFTACKDEDEDPVPEYDPVTAAFSFTAEGNTVTFVNASANAETFLWEFGDGETSTDESPVHEYAAPGTYPVKLTASNPEYEDEESKDVITENGGPIASFIIGKTWQAVRGEALAIAMGPQEDSWDWKSITTQWFTYGDLEGASAQLLIREALMNDEYVFNGDGTYNVDFKEDFWGEYGIWQGTEYDEVGIDIVDGSIPSNQHGNDVSAFVAGSWNWVVDEDNMKLAVSGAGAHILNPRYKNGESSHEAGDGIEYTVAHMSSSAEADTLVVYIETTDMDFNSEPRQYHILASYKSAVPEPKPLPDPAPPQFESNVASTTVSHTFLAEDGMGVGVHSVDGPYDVEYGVDLDGVTCTKLVKDDTEEDRWANYLVRAGTAGDPGERSEIDFSGGASKVSLDVYMPSDNDFNGTFKNLVRIRFIDESRLGGNFWQEYIQMEQADIALDEWVTLTFDFTQALADAAALEIPNIPDGVMIEFGEVDQIQGGTLYVKDFKMVAP